MTAEDESTTPQVSDQATMAGKPIDWLKLGRFILAGNPAYIISALLLIWSISRLSADSHMSWTEGQRLVFNFGALQFYQMLLAVTAVFLSRRAIWYDASLLAGFENLFLFVPFILVSQAIFLGPVMVWALCLTGGVLAVSRMMTMRLGVRDWRYPGVLYAMAFMFLAIHIALPLFFRVIYGEGDPRTDEPHFFRILSAGWLLGLPVLALLPNFIPRMHKRAEQGTALQYAWLPLLYLGLWVGATGVHLAAVGYVYGVKWSWFNLLPAVWVLAWTVLNRLTDIWSQPQQLVRRMVLLMPALLGLAAVYGPSTYLYPIMGTINVLLYAVLSWFGKDRIFARHMGLLSLAALAGGLSGRFDAAMITPEIEAKIVLAGMTFFVLLHALRSDNPKYGILGAISALVLSTAVTEAWAHDLSWSLSLGIEAAMVFLLAHSIRWNDGEHEGAAMVRTMVAMAWPIHALVWSMAAVPRSSVTIATLALTMITLHWVVRWWIPERARMIVAVSASASLIFAGTPWLHPLIAGLPSGVIALVISFALFGAGTGLALSRSKWHHASASVSSVTKTP